MSRNMNTWKPDGSGWRARIGVLTPDDDTVPESEFWTMAPDGVSVHAARVPLVDVRTYSDPPVPDNATELLARLPSGTRYAWQVWEPKSMITARCSKKRVARSEADARVLCSS